MKKKQVIKWIGLALCLCALVIGIVWGIKAISRKGDTPENEDPTGAVAQNTTEAKPEPTAPSSAEATEAPTKESEKSTEVATQAPTEEATEAPTEEATEAPTEETEESTSENVQEEIAVNWEDWTNMDTKDIRINVTQPKPITVSYTDNGKKYTANIPEYKVDSGLKNVQFSDKFDLSQGQRDKLAANFFVVDRTNWEEFYEVYESNRYCDLPSFVTTDSLLHTYHLYYQKLQRSTEQTYLYKSLKKLTAEMLNNTLQQFAVLRGTEWEEAAGRNIIYFGTAAKLLGIEISVPEVYEGSIDNEVAKILDASGFAECAVMPERLLGEDYSQYRPRSYYASTPLLSKYFRVMMWYGRINFTQQYEQDNRCALLMNLALSDAKCYEEWHKIYEVTSFLVGSSDDLLYNEYIPIITGIYGTDFTLNSLVGNEDAWEKFKAAIALLRGPEINSLGVWADSIDYVDWESDVKGYRFMGQRFVLDAAIFQNLLYDEVKPASDGDTRLTPDALDIPAAFGSDVALDLLVRMGNDKFPNYLDKMAEMREKVSKSDTYWTSSIYGGWLYALKPLVEEKGEGYPSFMTSTEWAKRSLEGFLGSWTELKHDTILYAKQAYSISESGGDDYYRVQPDDRGYVEPEPEVYDRLCTLAQATKNGLDDLGYLSEDDAWSLDLLIELCGRLRDISIKELQGEALTDQEYGTIRSYGGSLEHFWYESVDPLRTEDDEELAEDDCGYWYWEEPDPCTALVADVATNSMDELCLEEALGNVSEIYVIFPIDGELRLGRGGVYTQYQFTQSISARMTDDEWKTELNSGNAADKLQPWSASYTANRD